MLSQFVNTYKDEISITVAAGFTNPFFYPDMIKSLGIRANAAFPGTFQCPPGIISQLRNNFRSSSTRELMQTLRSALKQNFRGMSQVYRIIGLYPYSVHMTKKINEMVETPSSRLLGNVMVGASTALITTPWELIRLIDMKKTISPKQSLFEKCKKVAAQHGIKVFFGGYGGIALRNVTFTMGYINMVSHIKSTMPCQNIQEYLVRTLICSIAPAASFTAVLAPLDTVYVHFQAARAAGNYKAPSYSEILKSTYQKRGLSGFFVGSGKRFKASFKEALGLTLFGDACLKVLDKVTHQDTSDMKFKKIKVFE